MKVLQEYFSYIVKSSDVNEDKIFLKQIIHHIENTENLRVR